MLLSDMTELNFFIVLVHFVVASYVIHQMSKKNAELQKATNNKYVSITVRLLVKHRPIVILIAIVGPFIGYSISKEAKLGQPERGLQVHSPDETYGGSEGE